MVTTYHLPGVGFTASTGAQSYYNESALGSTLAVRDVNGNFSSRTEYDAYGITGTILQGTRSSFQFAGKHGYVTDDDTGMQLLGHRYYLPKLGRFLTQDPIGQAGGLNLYAYCENNPLTNVDPDGMSPEGSLGAWFLRLFGFKSNKSTSGLGAASRANADTIAALTEGEDVGGMNEVFHQANDRFAQAGPPIREFTNYVAGTTALGAVGGSGAAESVAAKGAQFFKQFAKRNAFGQTTRQIGTFTEFATSVPGNKPGWYTRWTKVVNRDGRTVRLYHDIFGPGNLFSRRGIKVPGPDRHVR